MKRLCAPPFPRSGTCCLLKPYCEVLGAEGARSLLGPQQIWRGQPSKGAVKMSMQSWSELWHRAQEGEALSDSEQLALRRALQEDPAAPRKVQRWQAAQVTLSRWPDQALPRSLAAELSRDIALSTKLSVVATPHLAARLAADIALSAQLGLAAPPQQPAAAPQSSRAFALAPLPRPAGPHPPASQIVSCIAAEQGAPAIRPPTAPPGELPALGRTRFNPPGGPSALGGAGVVLAFCGLTALHASPWGQAVAEKSGAPFGLTALGLTGPAATGTPLLSPLTMLGVALLAVVCWLIVVRPTPTVRRLGALMLSVCAVLTLPALWDAAARWHSVLVGTDPLGGRCLGAALLTVLTLGLVRGGYAPRLAGRQRRAPVQTLAAGTLAELALAGLGLVLLSLGWTQLSSLLGLLTLLAAGVGLCISLYAAGRGVARRLHLALPEVSGALAGLLAFSASLSVPALAASLMVVGGAWGLGTLLVGRQVS